MTVHDEPDGIADATHEQIRAKMQLLITAGGVIAEELKRHRERLAKIAEQTAQQSTRDAQLFKEADRAIRVGRLDQVMHDRWWDTATPEDVQLAWEDAVSWRGQDKQAAKYAERIKEQLRDRYGVDPDRPGPAGTAAETAAQRAAQARREQTAEQVAAAVTVEAVDPSRPERAGSGEQARVPGINELIRPEAAQGRQAGDQRDVPRAGQQWRDRQERLAQKMRGQGVPEDAIRARLLSDVGRGRPAAGGERAGGQGRPVAGRARDRYQPQRPQPQVSVGR